MSTTANVGLNALSGIGGVRTDNVWLYRPDRSTVLMPCRALEAFGRGCGARGAVGAGCVLMPCRALEAFGPTCTTSPGSGSPMTGVLMPCRALEAFGRRGGGLPTSGGAEGLNALSGIGGVRTECGVVGNRTQRIIRLNALSGIGGVRTMRPASE